MSVKIVVDNRLRLDLPLDVSKAVEEQFTYDNPDFFRAANMGFSTRGIPRQIRTWSNDDQGRLTLPRGGAKRLRAVLRANGLAWQFVDARCGGAADPEFEHRIPGGALFPFQRQAVDALLKAQNCFIRSGTGSGKSTLSMAAIAESHCNALVIVDTKGLAKQWIERAERELRIDPADIGMIGGGRFDLRPFTIGMPKSIVKRAENAQHREAMLGYFGFVVCDEVQGAAADTLQRSVDLFPARYRLGVSASEKRRDGKQFLIYDQFGDEPAFDIEREELVRQGFILDVEIRVVPTNLRAAWGGDATTGNAYDALLEKMGADADRNALAVQFACEEVLAGEQVLMLAHRREHCRALDQMLCAHHVPSGFLIGGDDYEAQFDRTKARLLSGDAKVGVGTYQAIGKGIDLPRIGVGVAVTPILANEQVFNQARGRFCRTSHSTGKTRARMYVLWDRHVFGIKHLKNCLKWNPTVTVYDEGAWVDGLAYLAKLIARPRP